MYSADAKCPAVDVDGVDCGRVIESSSHGVLKLYGVYRVSGRVVLDSDFSG